jgi:hypothetical protein
VALKIPFKKSFEDIGINRIVGETIEEFEKNKRNVKNGNAAFFQDLSVLTAFKSAQKIGDV